MKNFQRYFDCQDNDLPKSEKLEYAILNMIKDGVLTAGDAIPPQRDIANQFEIALSIVTKVCNKLKKRGILYGERGRGSFVAFNKQFAHDFGDRFFLDESYLFEKDAPQMPDTPILCNLVERLQFLNYPFPAEINFEKICANRKSLKEYGADYLRYLGIYAHPEDIMLSHNSYIALWTAFQLCCPAGTVLGAPALSFLPLFRNRLVAENVSLVPLASDQYGILPEALETACRGHRLNVLTCSPECELPTTKRMSRQRRIEIAELARKYDITIIEHNWLLPHETEPEIPALAMFAPERTISLEHGSKMLSCENFCSFSYIPRPLHEKFIYLRNIMAGPLSLMSRKITQFWLDSGYAKRDYSKKNKEIIRRNELVRKIMESLPIKIHKYARFCWLPLEKNKSGNDLHKKLQEQGILVSTAQNYLVGSVCPEEGILIGLGSEPSYKRLEKALMIIKKEADC